MEGSVKLPFFRQFTNSINDTAFTGNCMASGFSKPMLQEIANDFD